MTVVHDGSMTSRTTDLEITHGLRWLVGGLALLALGLVFGVLIAFGTDILDIDGWWNTLVGSFYQGIRPFSLLMDFLGGGWFATYVVPLGIALSLVVLRRPWGALMFLVATAVSAGIVQVLKTAFGRARPEEMLVISDHGSFPSGHTANAATMAVLLVILFPRVWVFVAGLAWTLLMGFSRTQVHAHWFSDTVGGAILGAGAALVVAAAFTVPILKERARAAGRTSLFLERAPSLG